MEGSYWSYLYAEKRFTDLKREKSFLTRKERVKNSPVERVAIIKLFPLFSLSLKKRAPVKS